MTNPTKTDTPIGAINICSNGKYANGNSFIPFLGVLKWELKYSWGFL